MVNPYAYFDCLSIGKRLQEFSGDFAAAEIHLFAYLACLLWLYKKRPVADWEYLFAGTKDGSPFSPDINKALYLQSSSGFIEQFGYYLQITDIGLEEYALLRSLSQNSKRETFIDGACSSILALPIGTIREAIFQEPELERVSKSPRAELLLDDRRVEGLYAQFETLSATIGVDVENLMVPAVVWLTYLSQIAETENAYTVGT